MQETEPTPERAPDPWQRLADWRVRAEGTAEELDELADIVTLPLASWVATRIGSAMASPEDVVQSIIARLIEKRGKIPTGVAECRRFVFATARRVLLEFFRETERMRQIVPLSSSSSSSGVPDLEASWVSISKTKMRDEGVGRLVEALKTLDPVDRDILMRMKLEGETSETVGRRHGLSATNVRNRLSNAMVELRRLLADLDVTVFFPE